MSQTDPQCDQCHRDMQGADIDAERPCGDNLCQECRTARLKHQQDERIADFAKFCSNAMNRLLDAVLPLLDGWEVFDLAGQWPWRLLFTRDGHAVEFSKNDKLTFRHRDGWFCEASLTTPPPVAVALIQAATQSAHA